MRVLVAGIGNIFFGDDGFGVEVAQLLAREPRAADAKVEDFGIRGMHLAYEMLAGYDRAIIVDAVPRGGEPGTLYVIEPELGAARARPTPTAWTCRTCSRSCACWTASRRRSRSSDASPRRPSPAWTCPRPCDASVAPAAALVRRLLAEQRAALVPETSGGIP